jgi:conjugative transfer signal peptidase TraF
MSHRRRRPVLPGWRCALTAITIASAVIAAASIVGSRFVWNVSPSLPRGLYRLDRGKTPSRGAVVAFEPPSFAAALIVQRAYLPRGVRLLKIVVGLPGDRVCIGDAFAVNGEPIGLVLHRDSSGRPLEPYRFCGTVPLQYAFVATPAAHSFDSRYFGPVPLQSLTPARPIWTF